MFKSIFSRLVTIFVLILLVAFSITGTMLYYFLNDFVAREKTETLKEISESINASFSIYMDNYNNPLIRLYFERMIDSYSSYTNSYVWIIDREGHIVISSPVMPEKLLKKYGDETGTIKLPDERQYKKVITESVPIMEIGDFYGFFKNDVFKENGLGFSWLTVGRALTYKDGRGIEKTVGAVYLHTPVPEIRKARSTVFKLFMYSVSFAIIVSIVLIYVFSSRISRPLKQINNAARIIASGEFGKRLDINSQDEIGALAGSFNQMAAALQNIEAMRRGFIANVSHELRTPMTSIMGFIEAILDGTIPPENHRDYLMVVKDEIGRLNRLANDLLDLAKIEAGEANLIFKDFDINELVRICIIKLERLIVEKDIQVEANFEDEETIVHADPDAIERVLYNLIHNAIKFIQENGRISISTTSQKGKVIVSVEDNGIGISRDEIDFIWDRFYKSDKSRSRDKKGTGLGLAIVKSIIIEHGQDIRVESEPGKGTRFIFMLDRP